MSQLDLALAADVSARHVSFLETGRAQPSSDMILRLAATLDVPLREQNTLLRAAGFGDIYEEPGLSRALDKPIAMALERMFAQQEPFPMTAMNRRYDVLRSNRAAKRLATWAIAEPDRLTTPLNAYRMFFDPCLARPFVVDWESTGREFLSRLHREALHCPEDETLTELVEELLAYPGVPKSWRQPDFSTSDAATYAFRLKRDDVELAFFTTVTTFSTPNNITLEELRIESYFPLDAATELTCRRLAENA